MRSIFSVLSIVTLLFGGGYFYNLAQAVCPVPINYRIGQLDTRFGLSLDEAKVAVTKAAEVWESATGQNLFTYDDEADFSVNFIYDERQAFRESELDFESRLNVAKNVNDVLTATYNSLVNDYESIKVAYKEKTYSYEQRFAEYNEKVNNYNDSGGAPKEVYAELKSERGALENERNELNNLAGQLNNLVEEINALGGTW